MRPVVVQRFHKHEIDQAISELIDRGFELVCPPVQQTKEGKKYKPAGRGRKAFCENIQETKWMAKLRKVE